MKRPLSRVWQAGLQRGLEWGSGSDVQCICPAPKEACMPEHYWRGT